MRIALSGIFLVAAGSAAGCASSGGGAACAAPEVSVAPERVEVGGSITVTGRFFRMGCDDHGAGETMTPMTGLDVVISQSGTRHVVAHVDAMGAAGTIETVVQLPGDIHTGQASVEVVSPIESNGVTIRVVQKN